MRGKRRRVSSSSDDNEPAQATAPKQASPNTHSPDSDVRAGRILQMTLKNFMCHSFLEVKFDGNVNFLTGNNGSGKSAILAALALGLGSKAKTTNRGNISSVKAFIKFGTNSASIEIILSNDGPQAYKPDEYGSKIIVNRSMSISGASNYRLKDQHAKIISRKMKDLHELVSALNIQVDNPVCILSQDTARNFLNASDPKIRFNLFYRATRLDNLSNLYEDSIRKKALAEQTYKVKKGQETQLVKETKKLDSKIVEAKKIEGVQYQLDTCKSELVWAQAVVNERKYEQHKVVVDKLVHDLEDLENVHEKHKEKLEKAQDEKRELEIKLGELTSSHNDNEKPVHELTLKLRGLERTIIEKTNSIASIERQLTYKKQDLDGIHKLINSYNERLSKIEERQQVRADEIAACEQKKKEKHSLVMTYEDETNKIAAHICEKESRMISFQQQLKASTNKINTLNDRLSTLQKDTNNPHAIYGPHYVRLINAIESDAQNFTRPPIGPIGTHVSVKDKKWTLAVEAQLGAPLLCSFLVNSQPDQNRLSQIIKRVWPQSGGGKPPSIIATKFVETPYDVSKNLVANHPNCTRLYDVLSVSNPIVMNCLIDQTNLESILLIPDKNFGLNIMKKEKTVPQNCAMVLTPQADAIYPYPNYKVYSGRLQNAKYIHVDCADAARQCQQAIAQETSVKVELRNNLQKIREEVAAAGEGVPRLKQQIAKCRHEIEAVTRKLNELQTEPTEAVGSIDDLQVESKELEKIIKAKSFTVNGTKMEIEELEEQVKGIKRDVKQYDDVRREARKAKEEIQDQINSHGYKVQSLVNEHARAKRRYEEMEANVTNEKSVLLKLQQNWEQLSIGTREEHGQRPKQMRRTDVIQEEINRLKLQLNELAKYDLEGLLLDLQNLHERINEHRDTMRETEQTLEELQTAKAGRKMKLTQTKKYMKDYAIYNFRNFLQCRNYQGNMNINYDDETLDMCVIPHSGARGITPTTNLSGGERSFSTVAFLYSLWKTLDFPFYILDEFDVYMDPQNRNLVIQILIDHAKQNKEVQYVFLTPQDISFIKDKEVAIHRLEDPERRALTQ